MPDSLQEIAAHYPLDTGISLERNTAGTRGPKPPITTGYGMGMTATLRYDFSPDLVEGITPSCLCSYQSEANTRMERKVFVDSLDNRQE